MCVAWGADRKDAVLHSVFLRRLHAARYARVNQSDQCKREFLCSPSGKPVLLRLSLV
jgi:hypothetical protein